MTRDHLYEYMRDPLLLSEKTLSELQTLADAYPYCSTFSFLYLFNLAIVDDVRYPSELRNRAPLLPDRRKLYRMVKAYRQAEVLSDVSAEKQPDSFELIDSFLGEMRAAGADLPDELVYNTGGNPSKDYFSEEQLSEESFSTGAFELPEKEKKEFRHEAQSHPNASEAAKEHDLDEELFTETLAKIYIKQQRYDKALRIIRSINLNFPEKNRYFADQIRFLEKLISNNQQKTL
ncbi:hypothetical protein HR11_01865 [Porphyromonas macacae]|uniref:hypothetical protein n=1 Tax=Porphyromonas macacae TaxID=28115 RepID=UPI00052B75C8|nr:hypothetical protein [Porphyromonas macacae]KGO00620.1 hypothetical protein HR11_01865 [Porphyromonas macacae]